jgi:hypothetical protein
VAVLFPVRIEPLQSYLCKSNIFLIGRLGGVVVSMLVTGPKGWGFEPSQGDGFLRAIKSIAHLPSDGK